MASWIRCCGIHLRAILQGMLNISIAKIWLKIVHSGYEPHFPGVSELSPGLLLLAWISNHMPSKMWDGITYPFPNFNGCTVEVWEWVSNFIPHFIMDVITCPMLGSMLIKGPPGRFHAARLVLSCILNSPLPVAFLVHALWINLHIYTTLILLSFSRGSFHRNHHNQLRIRRCNMAFIEPMHSNKPNITYLLNLEHGNF